MNKRLLDFLCCPKCKGDLDVEITLYQDDEIIEGNLKCKCNAQYKILHGIPRMVYPFDSIENSNNTGILKIQKSFEQEWKNFKVSDKTWGWDIEERKEIFLSEMEINDINELKQKILLDAGCGNGTLTIGLGNYGMEVIGIDLTSSVENAYRYNTNPNVHFIQGNIMYPPFKEHVFDLVYSSGVIHHTPDPKKTFNQLSSLLHNSGKIYVWVYRRDTYDKKFSYKLVYKLNVLTCRLPLFIQNIIYSGIAAILQIVQFFMKFSKKRKLNKIWNKTWGERKVWLYDMFSHRYQSLHSKDEISLWFSEKNFSILKFTDRKWGFGICGIKQS